MLYSKFLLVLFCLLFVAHGIDEEASDDGTASSIPSSSKTKPLELTSATFEHLTQAATGATTGDWLVMFYATWCGHCKRLHPLWEDIATELAGKVNVASVEVPTNPALGRRFNIKGFPTLIFFRGGKQWTYEGARDLDSLLEFANGGFEEQEGTVVVSPPDWKDDVKRFAAYGMSDLKLIFLQAKLVGAILIGLSLIIGFVLGRSTTHTSKVTGRPVSARGVKKNA